MSVWYLAHDDELLIDLDDYMRKAKSGEPWGEAYFRKRLRTAIDSKKLEVKGVWLDYSNSKSHFQAVVRLVSPMSVIERLVWQLKLGSDLLRGQSDLMRAVRGIKHPSLLIRHKEIRDFYREPDRTCPCTKKHITEEAPDCPVWRELRGMSPWQLFGEPYKGKERFVPLNIGKVKMELILRKDVKHG